MDRTDPIEYYRQLIENLMTDYCQWANEAQGSENLPVTLEHLVIFDRSRDRYLCLELGWQGKRRIDRTVLCVRIHHQKIWIEIDQTPKGFATDLLEAGLTPAEIVLAFYSPGKRALTEFAIA
jgi:hypothetical protein